MAKNSKEKSQKTGIGAKGGTTKMFGKSGADAQVAGVSNRPSLAPANNSVAKGGRTGIMGKQRNAGPSVPGKVSSTPGGGDTKFGVSGGNTKMFGQQGATTARVGTSSPDNGRGSKRF